MHTPGQDEPDELDKRIDEIVSRGPSGTFAVAGIATFIVVAIFFLFYWLVYLPRGTVQ
ncbi:hypothetical protein [Janthinobacterium sp. HLX7-2]|uniref:hypothetical protein n=1 Tax=Janthinobacterium sp. HLX7-2 TaxID=1259331 RepID=UPI003F2743A4